MSLVSFVCPRPSARHIPVLVAALFAAACARPGGVAQTARASDEWTHTYPLDPGGEVQLLNTSGAVEVEAGDTAGVEVHAERVAHATTEQGARDLLPHIEIRETSEPRLVAVETRPIKGVIIGASFEVNYRVKLPASASVRVRSANAIVRVTGVGGKATLSSAGGSIVGRALSGSVEARATNGNVDLELLKGRTEFVEVRAVNGRVDLVVPKSIDANLSATSVNGQVQVTDLAFERFGDSPRDARRVRGRINAGGFPIELNTVSGSIHVSGHE